MQAIAWTSDLTDAQRRGRRLVRHVGLAAAVGAVLALGVLALVAAYNTRVAVWTLAATPLLILFAVSLARPDWGYLVVIAVLPFQMLMFEPRGWAFRSTDDLRAVEFVAVPFLLAWLIHRGMRVGRPYRATVLEWSLGGLCAWAAVTLVWAPAAPHAALTLARFVVAVLLFFATVTLVQDRAILRRVVGMWLISCLLAAASGIVVWLADFLYAMVPVNTFYIPTRDFLISYTYIMGHRPGGLSPPLVMSMFCYMGQPLVLWRLVQSKRKWLWVLLWLVLLTAHRMAFKRTGMFGLLMGGTALLVCARFLRAHIVRYALAYYFLWFVGFMIPGIVIGNLGWERIARAVQTEGKLSLGSRIRNYKGVDAHMQRGYGPTAMGVGGARHVQVMPQHEHSIHLAVYFDLGLVGLAFYLTFVVVLAIRMFIFTIGHRAREDVALVGGLLAGCVALAVDGVLNHGYVYAYLTLYLGLCAAAWNVVTGAQTPAHDRTP